jgi:hypothetical protein
MHRAPVPGRHEGGARVARHPGDVERRPRVTYAHQFCPVENVALLTCAWREMEARGIRNGMTIDPRNVRDECFARQPKRSHDPRLQRCGGSVRTAADGLPNRNTWDC